MENEKKYPVALHTVDIAIIKLDGVKTKVLLAQKVKATEAEKDLWRFPGGFVEPKHSSAEEAAAQEVHEETGGMAIHPKFEYIGSIKIDDPRFRESQDKIITTFYEAQWKSGEAGEGPFDDIARTKWFDIDELDEKIQNPIHKDLFNMLLKRHNVAVKTNEFVKDAGKLVSDFGKNVEKTAMDLEKGASNLVNKAKDKLGKLFNEDK